MKLLFLEFKNQNKQSIENYDLPIVQDDKGAFYVVEDTNHINIFVGANNTGKSRFLRALFCSHVATVNENEITKPLSAINTYLNNFRRRRGDGDLKDIIGSATHYTQDPEKFMIKASVFLEFCKAFKLDSIAKFLGQDEAVNQIKTQYRNFLDHFFRENQIKHKIYIPILRGVRPLVDKNGGPRNEQDDYKVTTEYHYFKGCNSGDTRVFTGQSFYEDVKKMLLGSLDEREKIQKYQVFIGESFFDGQQTALIPKETSKTLEIKIGKQKERPIHDVGDGLQSLLIISFSIFTNPHATILIEEPEFALHPGMQRRLLKIITDMINNETFYGQVFFTTHSNHFLDMTNDFDNISVYRFSKVPDKEDPGTKEIDPSFSVSKVATTDRNTLSDLGVKPSSVLITNSTIWVEGITDRLLIRKYFEVWQKAKFENREISKIFEEDTHYSFVEYGGSNITHWSFLEKDESINEQFLCGECFLIADRDFSEEEYNRAMKSICENSHEKLKRHYALREKLGKRYHVPNCWEIENTISEGVKEKILENTAIANALPDILKDPASKFANTKLNLSSDHKKRFRGLAIQYTQTACDLSEIASDMCSKIYDHINKCNLTSP